MNKKDNGINNMLKLTKFFLKLIIKGKTDFNDISRIWSEPENNKSKGKKKKWIITNWFLNCFQAF